jgi:hypothetical protein
LYVRYLFSMTRTIAKLAIYINNAEKKSKFTERKFKK